MAVERETNWLVAAPHPHCMMYSGIGYGLEEIAFQDLPHIPTNI
jgi:hypothetical protein